jgi:hypothetical protein
MDSFAAMREEIDERKLNELSANRCVADSCANRLSESVS